MKKRNYRYIEIFIIIVVVLFFSIAGYYVSRISDKLWLQSVTEIREVTVQGARTLDVYIKKTLASLHSITANLSKIAGTQESAYMNSLTAFNEDNCTYYIINFDEGTLYSGTTLTKRELTEEERTAYREIQGSGLRAPYMSEETGQKVLGYYEAFTFSDGQKGLLLKEELLFRVADQFSLSFYDNTGFSYIVDNEGTILIRSLHKESNRTFKNVFDVISFENNDSEDIETFRQSLENGENGVVRFSHEAEEYVYAYNLLSDTDGWYFISIIPNSAIMKQLEQILKTSQIFVYLILTSLVLFTLFMYLVRRNRKNVVEKDKEIYYREQLFNVLSNNTDEIFVMYDLHTHNLEYISPNIERVLGICLEDADTMIKETFLSDDDTSWQELDQMQAGSSIVKEEVHVHHQTGENRWFIKTIYRETVDKTDKFIICLSDHTADRKKEQALEEALEIARTANQAKSAFLSNMSHDIRTPMNAIVGLCTLLRRDADQVDKVRNYTKKITASSQHLLGLINDILDMSKIESGKTTLNISEINLAEIVEELETIMREQVKAKHQTFEISVFNIKSEYVLGDHLRINQILINILSNAVKYTPDGGKIEMIVRQMPKLTDNYVNLRFIIKDNGIGMSEEYQEKIFQPFTREHTSMTSKAQGTGLGMAIVKNLIDLMGGSITVESKVNEGSTFTVDLELRMLEKEIDEKFWVRHGIGHVLVVDDDQEVCDNVVSTMAHTGVTVQAANNGYSAIKMVEREIHEDNEFDLVLLDWKMPEMDGIETAKKIRELIPDRVPIMILSAYDWSEIEEQATAAKIDAFIPKPFFLSNFKLTIEKLVSKQSESEETKVGILSGKHILVAEDNELNSEILVELLAMEEATCDVCENGQIALERFVNSAEHTYDLILMDVQMPIMNGYEATRKIRSSNHAQAKSIPIIAMTANAFIEDIKEALGSGMDAHVAKPIDMDRLENAVKDIMEKAGE